MKIFRRWVLVAALITAILILDVYQKHGTLINIQHTNKCGCIGLLVRVPK